MQVQCETCLGSFMAPLAPCPDGIDGCAVAHYNKQSWTCPKCGHDNGPSVARTILKGLYVELPGIGIANLNGVKKLHLE